MAKDTGKGKIILHGGNEKTRLLLSGVTPITDPVGNRLLAAIPEEKGFTMKFTMGIKMDNAAFEDDPSYEVARILREAARRIEGHPHFSPGHEQPLYDVNGNNVGCFDVWAE